MTRLPALDHPADAPARLQGGPPAPRPLAGPTDRLHARAAERAVTEVCLQGSAAGLHAGVQFHPEATRPIVASWLANTDPPPGQEVTGPLFKGADSAWKRASASAGTFFSAWLDGGL